MSTLPEPPRIMSLQQVSEQIAPDGYRDEYWDDNLTIAALSRIALRTNTAQTMVMSDAHGREHVVHVVPDALLFDRRYRTSTELITLSDSSGRFVRLLVLGQNL